MMRLTHLVCAHTIKLQFEIVRDRVQLNITKYCILCSFLFCVIRIFSLLNFRDPFNLHCIHIGCIDFMFCHWPNSEKIHFNTDFNDKTSIYYDSPLHFFWTCLSKHWLRFFLYCFLYMYNHHRCLCC